MKLRDIKIQAIEDALIRSNGNKTRAAKELGVSIRWLTNWIRREPELERFRIEQSPALRARRVA